MRQGRNLFGLAAALGAWASHRLLPPARGLRPLALAGLLLRLPGQMLVAGTQVARRPVVADPDADSERAAAEEAAPARDPAADLAPEDLVLKDAPKPRPKRRRPAAGGKRRKHGRSR